MISVTGKKCIIDKVKEKKKEIKNTEIMIEKQRDEENKKDT